MKRIYILEGPDGCGKSVLATDLAARLKPAALTRHGPYPGDREVWRRYLYSMLPAYADLADVILDRAWLSEPIYGAAYRGGANRIAAWQRRMLERVALGRGAAVVLCRTAWATCKENFRLRKAEGGEMLDDVTQLRQVYDAYKSLTYRVGYGSGELFTPHFTYHDYNSPRDADDVLATFDDIPANLGPGIGCWAPRKSILLVGERPGGFGGRWHLPFVSLRADGCSAWLAEQLEAGDIPEAALYWVNTWDGPEPHGVRLNVPALLKALQPRRVVALGEVANAWLGHFGVRGHLVVDHPQHHKRFHSKQPYSLIKELRTCLK